MKEIVMRFRFIIAFMALMPFSNIEASLARVLLRTMPRLRVAITHNMNALKGSQLARTALKEMQSAPKNKPLSVQRMKTQSGQDNHKKAPSLHAGSPYIIAGAAIALFNAQDSELVGAQELQQAIILGDFTRVKALINKNKKLLNYTNAKLQFKTPLMLATQNNHTHVALFLMSEGAAVNYRDSWGRTAAMFAAHQGNTQILAELIKRDANLDFQSNERSEYQDSALTLALKNDHSPCVALLLDANASTETWHFDWDLQAYCKPFHVAVKSGNLNSVLHFIQRKPYTLNSLNDKGISALHIAANRADLKMVELLLNAGIDASLESTPGYTAEYIALWHFNNSKSSRAEYMKIVQLLKKHSQKTAHPEVDTTKKSLQQQTVDANQEPKQTWWRWVCDDVIGYWSPKRPY